MLDELVDPARSITYGVVKPGVNPTDGVLLIRGGDISDGRINVGALRRIAPDLSEQYQRTVLQGGELVVSLVGNPGEVAIVPFSLRGANLARQAGLVPLRPEIESKYVMYYLMSPWGRAAFGAETKGSVQRVINLADLRRVRVPMPPDSVQRRIASILSAYDDLIENNTRRIAILEELPRRIYEEWFVHFRFPGYQGVRMVESELAMVPDSWRVVEVQEIVRRLPSGTVYKQSDVQNTGHVPVVDQSTAELLGFHSDEPAHRATPGAPIVIFGDHTCKMQLMLVPFSLGPNTVPFVAQGLPVHYAYALLSGLVSTHEYKRHWSELMKKKVAVANRGLAQRYATLVQPMAELLESLKRANRNLRATRDLLLPKLISGELDVSAMPEPEALAA